MPIFAWGIAEINMGILCSCIPVAFVLFKGMAERSSTWASRFWCSFTGGYRKTTDPSRPSKGQMDHQHLNYQANHDPELPRVPKATMTGLRSFFDKFGRSRAEKTQATADTDELDLTVMSVDCDYHTHLRAGYGDRRP
ncbi:hypothetical protein Daus18300_012638 [Diaporthe australafricana]|uniref:Uncharacterized protein n=1 Tax=Diaporthe australafricana TaxID=127596 RepID=A0ABR3W205_9PEZI